MTRISPVLAALAAPLLLSACGSSQPAADQAALADPAGEGLGKKPAAAPTVAAMPPDKLANPCLLDPKAVGAALGFAVDKTEPETMGAMSGCTYRGGSASLRLNFIAHDPAYFDKATRMTRDTRPGEKRDIAGDPDKAWIQHDSPSPPVLHYYRQNVEVELVPLFDGGGDAAKVEAGLLKLPRVP